METERQAVRRNRALWYRMRDQFDQQAAFLGGQFNGGRTIGINMAAIAYNVRCEPAGALIAANISFTGRTAPAPPSIMRRLFEARSAVNRRTAARQLGAAFGALLRLAFNSLFQHAASPSAASPKKSGCAFASGRARLRENFILADFWRTLRDDRFRRLRLH